MKAILYLTSEGDPIFWCPGCNHPHKVWVKTKNERTGAQWSWNGDLVKPTFQPSINVIGSCHSFVRDGNIEFLSDCTHALAGKTVPLPEFEL